MLAQIEAKMHSHNVGSGHLKHCTDNTLRGHVRGSPFLNVLVLYGHCPNSFRPYPSVKGANVEKKVPQIILGSP